MSARIGHVAPVYCVDSTTDSRKSGSEIVRWIDNGSRLFAGYRPQRAVHREAVVKVMLMGFACIEVTAIYVVWTIQLVWMRTKWGNFQSI